MAEKGKRMRINVVKVEESKYCPQRSAVEVHISTAWCSFEACKLINEQREAHNEQREAHSHKIGRLFGDSPNGP